MRMTAEEWHDRYTQQAKWTSDLRHHLYAHLDIKEMNKILDVGCGTGVISKEIYSSYCANVHGLDLERANLDLAKKYAPKSHFALGDAHVLPYPSRHFDLTFCHFLLLWVRNPIEVVREMARVTRMGGYVVVFAEPDYGGRIDFPGELAILGKWQQESLYKQGANVQLGRQLAEIFNKSDLGYIEVGVLGGQWSGDNLIEDWLIEWLVLEDDLSIIVADVNKWEAYKSLDFVHRKKGDRILFVPTFYAYGQVKS